MATRTMVFRYGLLHPVENASLIEDEVIRSHAYRNTLIAIERARRVCLDDAVSDERVRQLVTELARLNERAEELAREVKKSAGKARSKKQGQTMAEDATAQLRRIRNERKETSRTLGRLRQERRQDPAVKAEAAEIEKRADVLRKAAREHCGVYWGTYLLVESAAKQSFSETPFYEYARLNLPHFLTDREGSVGVQVQGGIEAKKVYQPNTLAWIEGMDPVAWYGDTRGQRRKAARPNLKAPGGPTGPMLHMRVQSNEKGRPVWAAWPIILHRPLPPDAVIKRLTVHRKMRFRGLASPTKEIGPRPDWQLDVTVTTSAPLADRKENKGLLAMHFGWRQRPDGTVRVAVWADQHGNFGELVLPLEERRHRGDDPKVPSFTGSVLTRIRYADDLRSIRDKNFDGARDGLATWLGLHGDIVPAWLAEKTSSLSQWRSPARLAMVVRRWANERFAGDEEIFELVEAWRRQDYHLWTWQDTQRLKSTRHRRQLYRKMAVTLARSYDRVVWGNFVIADVAKKPEPGSPADVEVRNQSANRTRQAAAVGDLRMAISQAFLSRGGDQLTISCEDETVTCHACHHVNAIKRHAFEAVDMTCTGCGAQWDQDENAVKNVLASVVNGTRPITSEKYDAIRWWTHLPPREREAYDRQALSDRIERLETICARSLEREETLQAELQRATDFAGREAERLSAPIHDDDGRLDGLSSALMKLEARSDRWHFLPTGRRATWGEHSAWWRRRHQRARRLLFFWALADSARTNRGG
jgi:transposase